MNAQETVDHLMREAVGWFDEPENLLKVRPIQLVVGQALVDFEALVVGTAEVITRKTPNYERDWALWNGALSARLVFNAKEKLEVDTSKDDFGIYVAVGSRMRVIGGRHVSKAEEESLVEYLARVEKDPSVERTEELFIRVQRGFSDGSNDVCLRKTVLDAWRLIQKWRSEGRWTV